VYVEKILAKSSDEDIVTFRKVDYELSK